MKEQEYNHIYDKLIKHPMYDERFFKTYDEFLIFCKKDYSNLKGLQKLVLSPEIEFKQVITNTYCEYFLTHDAKGEINKPITYWKFSYFKR